MSDVANSLSVFLPTYNEQDQIKKTVKNVKDSLVKLTKNWEIIIVNDGSSDNTAKIVAELAKKDKNIKILTHNPNRGYGASLKTGLYNAKYPWIAFIDSDGQFDFSEISTFIKTQKETGADLVIGYYLRRQVSLRRRFNTFAWQTIVNLLFGLSVRDIDCGFKLLSKKVVDTIPQLESERGAFISSELLIKAKKAGFKIVEIPVHHYPRLTGEGTGAKLNVIIKSFVDLFKLWKKLL